MRVISGLYRGRVLKSPPDNKTRPTSDRLRETLFNVLAPRIDDETRFLDLCAGTGAIGIEALSRGAAFVTFVDRSKRSCALIEENLDKLDVPESQTEILGLDAENFTGREHEQGWDIAFFDPPYEAIIRSSCTISVITRLCLMTAAFSSSSITQKRHMPDDVGALRRWRILKQGETPQLLRTL